MKKFLTFTLSVAVIAALPVMAYPNDKESAENVFQACKEKHSGNTSSLEFLTCITKEAMQACITDYGIKDMIESLKCAKPIQEIAFRLADNHEFKKTKPFLSDQSHFGTEHMDQTFFDDDQLLSEYNGALIALSIQSGKKHIRLKKTEANLLAAKKVFCTGYFDEIGYSSQRAFDECNRIFGRKTYLIKPREYTNQSTARSVPSKKRVNSHDACLDAKDYQGCMSFTGSNNSSSAEERCNPDGWCIAKKGVDSLGFPKKVGWKYKMMDSGSIWYVNTVYKRIPHNGDSARYLGFEMIRRYYKNPTSGTPGRQTTIGSSRTNCTGYGVSISCTTTPPTVITTPGTSGSPGGKRSTSSVYVLDCKDKTTANYQEGRLKGKWKKADAGAGKLIKYQCPIISTLPVLSMKL